MTRELPDGRATWLAPLMFGGGRLCVAPTVTAIISTDVYDFEHYVVALFEFFEWDGTESPEPRGWYRHRPSNRRRPDGDPSKEYVAE